MTTSLPINQIQALQFDDLHMTIILGLPALLFLYLGTALYEISQEKYTFAHGVCAGLALLLTTINIVAILPLTDTILRHYSQNWRSRLVSSHTYRTRNVWLLSWCRSFSHWDLRNKN
jgi:NhaP-type Na+/H+ or K+/H+ antiporter